MNSLRGKIINLREVLLKASIDTLCVDKTNSMPVSLTISPKVQDINSHHLEEIGISREGGK